MCVCVCVIFSKNEKLTKYHQIQNVQVVPHHYLYKYWCYIEIIIMTSCWLLFLGIEASAALDGQNII